MNTIYFSVNLKEKKSHLLQSQYIDFLREKKCMFFIQLLTLTVVKKKLKNYAESVEGKSKLVIRKLGSKVPITFNYRGDFQMWLIENIDNILGYWKKRPVIVQILLNFFFVKLHF